MMPFINGISSMMSLLIAHLKAAGLFKEILQPQQQQYYAT
jgi:hypothetical protein